MSFHYFIVCYNQYDGGLEYDEILRMDDRSDYDMRVSEFVEQGFSVLFWIGLPAQVRHPAELCVLIRREGQ